MKRIETRAFVGVDHPEGANVIADQKKVIAHTDDHQAKAVDLHPVPRVVAASMAQLLTAACE